MLDILQQAGVILSDRKELKLTRHSHEHVLQRHDPEYVLGHPFSQARMGEVGILQMLLAPWSELIRSRSEM
jgi:hypothetical protein